MLRLWLTIGVGVAVLAVSGAVASMSPAQAQPTADPMAVITAYEMARNRRDVDTALTYFADNAVITQRNTTFAGKDDIRRFLDGMAARSRFIVVSDRRIVGNHVTWTERSGTAIPQTSAPQPQQSRSPGLGGTVVGANGFAITVEAVVQDGKIQSLSYMFAGQSAPVDPTLAGRAELPAVVGLGAVLAVLLAVLMVGSTGVRRRTLGDSSLRGRLMQDLRGWSAARQ